MEAKTPGALARNTYTKSWFFNVSAIKVTACLHVTARESQCVDAATVGGTEVRPARHDMI